MNYLLDKKTKRNKYYKIFLGLIIFIVILYFRAGIFSGLSYVSSFIFRPIITSGNSVIVKIKNIGAYFSSKDSLYRENEDLKFKIEEDRANRTNYDSVVRENLELKDILGRKSEQMNLLLANILAKPNQSLYDTLLIDIGENYGLKIGDRVFAFGNIPIGRVSEVYYNSSKVSLFSSSGESNQVMVSPKPTVGESTLGDIFLEATGRGGGNFEMIIPRDFVIAKGDQIIFPDSMPYVLGIVETVISDPRDSFQKALLVSPVNIQQIKFVQVEIQN